MNTMKKVIYGGFAAAALAGASMPAFSWAPYPGVDFEWYASVGRPAAGQTIHAQPAPRPGYIWSSGHYDWNGVRHAWVPGRWVVDDYARQVAIYNTGTQAFIATGPVALRDRDGNLIPTDTAGYSLDSMRR